jgi:CHAD domain-containing protein
MEVLSPEEPVSVVARQVLCDRWSALRSCLSVAVAGPGDNLRAVHQLRIAARRLTAAAQLFANEILSAGVADLHGGLQRLYRATGRARDLDMLIQRWMGSCAEPANPSAAAILQRLHSWRATAQEPIRQCERELSGAWLERCQTGLLEAAYFRTRRPGQREPAFVRAAPVLFLRPVRRFLRTWHADLETPAALHAVRAAGRRVRYAMEILAPAFDNRFRNNLGRRLRELLDLLGAIQDHTVAGSLGRQLRDTACSRGEQQCLDQWLEREAQGLVESRRRFLRWWTPRQTGRLRRGLMQYALAPIG